jgi:hypothetical protein
MGNPSARPVIGREATPVGMSASIRERFWAADLFEHGHLVQSESQPSADTAARNVRQARISPTSDAQTLSSACLAARQ